MSVEIVSQQALAFSGDKKAKRKPISLHTAMNRFLDRDDSELKLGQRYEYEHALLILQEYVNGFGKVMLRAAGANPMLAERKDGTVAKTFDPNSLVSLFRGYSLFFLNFKLNAPEDVKRVRIQGSDEKVQFAGLVHQESPDSGVYGGTSLIWFPVTEDNDKLR
ncbi:MAG: hypothetical protein K2X77_33795 [Candidatus Obscuribacterales bacterium]|nr:hypothetical protein [Candidatus Obscuribacterales bacterium]